MPSTELLVGDPAPTLTLRETVKGTPFTGFSPGRVSVVEFWASWCGPCLSSIPHLTALQAAHSEISVVGVNVLESDLETVRTFVREQGDGMGYTVVIDGAAAEGDTSGPTHDAWCRASYQPGIPASFIVDQDGLVAWMGHPMQIDEPLAAVIEKRWDRAAEAERHREMLAKEKVRETAQMMAALNECDPDDERGALRIFDETFAAHPEIERTYAFSKLKLMLVVSPDAALGYARRLIARPDERDRRLQEVGSALTDRIKARAEEGASVDAALIACALEVLQEAERFEWHEDKEFRQTMTHVRLAEVLLVAERPREAFVNATEACRVGATTLHSSWLAKIEALRDRCATASASNAASTDPAESKVADSKVVCEGGVCRIVP